MAIFDPEKASPAFQGGRIASECMSRFLLFRVISQHQIELKLYTSITMRLFESHKNKMHKLSGEVVWLSNKSAPAIYKNRMQIHQL